MNSAQALLEGHCGVAGFAGDETVPAISLPAASVTRAEMRSFFWPPSGFLLGVAIPRDPWGREFRLRREKATLWIASLGADGKPGGTSEDEDAEIRIHPPPRQPVGAPTERLRRHYAAMVQLSLLAASVGAYRRTFAELPGDGASLVRRPAWATVWPDLGFVQGGKLPTDAWGHEFEIAGRGTFARVQVRDAATKQVFESQLTAEERKALEAVGQPRLDENERKELAKLVDRLCDHDVKVREDALREADEWGSVLAPALEARAKTEKDEATRQRLDGIRWILTHYRPPWTQELVPLYTVISPSSAEEGDKASNERVGRSMLKEIFEAQKAFRSQDRDGNTVNDFWTGDVSGLFTLSGPDGKPVKLISLSTAAAEGSWLEDGAAGGKYALVTHFTDWCPKSGYLVRAMTVDRSSDPAVPYGQETGGTGKGPVRNVSRFAFCAYPYEYNVTGINTFIMNETGTIYSAVTGGLAVTEWPTAQELEQSWRKVD